MMFRDRVQKFMLGLLDGVVPLPGLEVVQVPGGVAGGVHLIGRVERGEVDLELVIVLPVQLHLLKPVTPQYLTRQIGSPWNAFRLISCFIWLSLPCLECHIAGLIGSLQNDQKFKPLPGKIVSSHVVKWRVLINDMDNVQWPDKEDARL